MSKKQTSMLESGVASVLLDQLTKLCGPLPEDLEQQLRQLSIEGLKELGKALLDFRSVQDVQAWLAAHEEFTG
jgi:hypothetical protein